MEFPARGRIVDLSAEVCPGILKVSGEYTWGSEVRRCELRQFRTGTDHTLMHWFDTETHIGTHVEVPAHLFDEGRSCAEMPLETFLGEAVVLRFDHACTIGPSDFEEVRAGDIVLLWSPAGGPPPAISLEGAQCLAGKPIKMLGVQNVSPDDPRAYEAGATVRADTHEELLRKDIPIIEGLVNLETLPQQRVFFMGLPLRVAHMDSSWIRAVAICP